jgi:hypothetical protein
MEGDEEGRGVEGTGDRRTVSCQGLTASFPGVGAAGSRGVGSGGGDSIDL